MLARQVNVKVESQTVLFDSGNVWHYAGKHLSLLILFTMHKGFPSSLVMTVVHSNGYVFLITNWNNEQQSTLGAETVARFFIRYVCAVLRRRHASFTRGNVKRKNSGRLLCAVAPMKIVTLLFMRLIRSYVNVELLRTFSFHAFCFLTKLSILKNCSQATMQKAAWRVPAAIVHVSGRSATTVTPGWMSKEDKEVCGSLTHQT